MQTSQTSSKSHYRLLSLKTVELYAFSEQEFTFRLQHLSKLCLFLLFFDDIFC